MTEMKATNGMVVFKGIINGRRDIRIVEIPKPMSSTPIPAIKREPAKNIKRIILK